MAEITVRALSPVLGLSRGEEATLEKTDAVQAAIDGKRVEVVKQSGRKTSETSSGSNSSGDDK